MACLNTLKLEIKTLERIFTKNHERFRILNASVDELTCRFIGKNGKNYDIHANITVSLCLFSIHHFFSLLFFFVHLIFLIVCCVQTFLSVCNGVKCENIENENVFIVLTNIQNEK